MSSGIYKGRIIELFAIAVINNYIQVNYMKICLHYNHVDLLLFNNSIDIHSLWWFCDIRTRLTNFINLCIIIHNTHRNKFKLS